MGCDDLQKQEQRRLKMQLALPVDCPDMRNNRSGIEKKKKNECVSSSGHLGGWGIAAMRQVHEERKNKKGVGVGKST